MASLELYAAAFDVLNATYIRLRKQVELVRKGQGDLADIAGLLDRTIPTTSADCAITSTIQFLASSRDRQHLISGLFKDRQACLLLLADCELIEIAIQAEDVLKITRQGNHYIVTMREASVHNMQRGNLQSGISQSGFSQSGISQSGISQSGDAQMYNNYYPSNRDRGFSRGGGRGIGRGTGRGAGGRGAGHNGAGGRGAGHNGTGRDNYSNARGYKDSNRAILPMSVDTMNDVLEKAKLELESQDLGLNLNPNAVVNSGVSYLKALTQPAPATPAAATPAVATLAPATLAAIDAAIDAAMPVAAASAAVPVEAAPVEAAPVEAAPVEAAPVEAMPVAVVPSPVAVVPSPVAVPVKSPSWADLDEEGEMFPSDSTESAAVKSKPKGRPSKKAAK